MYCMSWAGCPDQSPKAPSQCLGGTLRKSMHRRGTGGRELKGRRVSWDSGLCWWWVLGSQGVAVKLLGRGWGSGPFLDSMASSHVAENKTQWNMVHSASPVCGVSLVHSVSRLEI